MAKKLSKRVEDNMEGTVVYNIPFPTGDDLSILKEMSPIVIKFPYSIDYNFSYGQDSPFFAALANKRFIVSREPETGYTYANPRGHDMYTGKETEWVEIQPEGKIHAFTTCYFGSEAFLDQTPFILILVEFEGVDTLFLGPPDGGGPGRGQDRVDREEGEGPFPAEFQIETDGYLFQHWLRMKNNQECRL